MACFLFSLTPTALFTICGGGELRILSPSYNDMNVWNPFNRIKQRRREPLQQLPEASRTQQDRTLVQRLHTAFEQDLELVDLHGLQFYVQDGVVTIYGLVRHELDRDMLLSFVRQVPGVKGIDNRLQIVEGRFQYPVA